MRPLPYLLALLVTALASIGYRMLPEPDPRILPEHLINHTDPYSNIMPGDYMGPDSCVECHPTQHNLWKDHPHAKMNQLPSKATVLADFDDAALELPGGTATFTTIDDDYFMSVHRDGKLFRRYLVTRTVGSRFMQYFIGKQLRGPEAEEDDIYGEHMLPFAYWFELQRWFPRAYFDNDGHETLVEGLPVVEAVTGEPDVRPYTAVCINCHNTFPYALRVFHDRLVGFKQANVQLALEQMCSALEPDFESEVSIEEFRKLNRQLNPDKDLVTLGISCESCHFGGREHVQHQREMRFLPTNPMLKVTPHDDSLIHSSVDRSPAVINGICTQCHSGAATSFVDGGKKANSSEGFDLLAGSCASQLSCIDCHAPHSSSPFTEHGATNPKHVEACVRCHDKYSDPSAAIAHSGHQPTDGVNCLDCHMPRYLQGLNGLQRTHRVSMPVDREMMATSSANACNTCHIDRSLRWTLNELKEGWGIEIEPKPDWENYHALNVPASSAWGNGKDSHMRYVAAQCIAEKGIRENRPTQQGLTQLLHRLNDSEGGTRVYTENAIRDYLGIESQVKFPVNIVDTPLRRQQQITRWLDHLESNGDVHNLPSAN